MRKAPSQAGAFTLIELLAAVAVAVLLGLMLAQVTTSISRSTKRSAQLIDAATQARFALDCLAFDLAGMVRRADADFAGQNLDATQPQLLFLSSGTPRANDRGLAVVAYEVSAHPDNADAHGSARPCLVRGAKAIPWQGGGAVPNAGFMGLQANGLPLAFNGGAFPSALLPGSTQDFQVLAPGAIRMLVAFQLYPDNKAVTLLDGYAPTPNLSRGQIVYSPPRRTLAGRDGSSVSYADMGRVAAVVVGLVVLDNGTLPLLSAAQAQELGAAFPAPAEGDGKTPLQAWAAAAAAAASLPSDIPLPVRQALRVYERSYPVNPFPNP